MRDPGYFEFAASRTESGDLAGLKALLSERPELVTERDPDGRSLLHEAVFNDSEPMVSMLLQMQADPNVLTVSKRTPLHECAYNATADMARRLLEHGADPSLQDDLGYTPLHIAAEDGHSEMVSLLITSGAPLETVDAHGRTPSRLARLRGKNDVATLIDSLRETPQSRAKPLPNTPEDVD